MRRLTTKLIVAATAIGGGYWAARELAPAIAERAQATAQPQPAADAVRAPATSAAAPGASKEGENLLGNVLDTLERRPNLAARFRQSMHVGQEHLTGEGSYWQQGVGNQRRSRWELKTIFEGDSAFITQICDGDHVWTDRRLSGNRKITRVYLAQLRRELALTNTGGSGAGQGGSPPDMVALELFARGGLSQLLAELRQCFEFGPVQTLSRGDRTVSAVIGHWRPEELERQWPGLAAASAGEWPAHLPHHVLLYVDNDYLFPCLVEYRGASQIALATSDDAYFPAHEPLAEFEFIDVQVGVAMAANLFQFTSEETQWHDVTDRVVEEIRRHALKAEPLSTAQRPGATSR